MHDLTIANGVVSIGARGNPISADAYFAAVDRYGSPALSPAQLAAAGPDQRNLADQVLLRADDLELSRPSGGVAAEAGGCRPAFGPDVGFGRSFTLRGGGLLVLPRGTQPLTIAARRFATGFQPLRLPRGAQSVVLKPAKRFGRRVSR